MNNINKSILLYCFVGNYVHARCKLYNDLLQILCLCVTFSPVAMGSNFPRKIKTDLHGCVHVVVACMPTQNKSRILLANFHLDSPVFLELKCRPVC